LVQSFFYVILLYVGLVVRSILASDEKAPNTKEFRLTMARALFLPCERLNSVIENLLDMSRLNSTQIRQQEWKIAAREIPLIVLKSPYRSIIAPIVEYIESVERDTADEIVTVIIPEFVTAKWYHQILHNQTAIVLYAALRGRRNIAVTSVCYHLD
jgi:hypothetical protein